MTLRTRLSLAFVLVVFVPIAIGAILVGRSVPAAMHDRVADQLHAASAGAQADLARLCGRAQLAAEVLARTSASASARTTTHDLVSRGLVDYAVVTGKSGAVQAAAGKAGAARMSMPAPAHLGNCADDTRHAGAGGAIAATATVRSAAGASLGTAATAIRYQPVALRLARNAGVGITFVGADGSVRASTLSTAKASRVAHASSRAIRSSSPVAVGGMLVSAVPAGSQLVVIASAPPPSFAGFFTVVGAVIGGGLAIALLLGWLLARLTTRPLAELTDAAKRVGRGDLDTRIAVRSGDEIGQLTEVFNEMTGQLSRTVLELTESRDEMRTILSRLGDSLSSTLDLKRTLNVIMDTAMASGRARAGALFLHAPTRGDLYLAAGRGLDARGVPRSLRVPLGEGVLGRVALTGNPVVGPVRAPDQPIDSGLRRSEHEPDAEEVVAVPLSSGDRTLGALALYDRRESAFDERDLDTIRSFAGHAAVAIDNVLRAQDTQRASITDGLTGVWNYRYFQTALAKEVERAARFGRPLALLMLDLDHFKRVNDEHGHPRGDAVLAELAHRLRAQVREVDTIARYGGEEMIIVLPETELDGAQVVAERICSAVRQTPFGDADEEPLLITVSIGFAAFPQHGETMAGLVRSADDAMYAAKREGRDRWRAARSDSGDIGSLSLSAGQQASAG
jgi:diguanylate cyclase (GGDEF)-like protein